MDLSERRKFDSQTLVLIGGSGDVGRHLIPLLQSDGRWGITLLSRGGGVPEGLSPSRLAGRPIDIRTPGSATAIPDGATVVNLTEATPPVAVAAIIARGGTVLDTSATPGYIYDLSRAARNGPGLLVLCVGTAPGLSTLMGAEIARGPNVDSIDIGLELGMGRHYGLAATEWFIRALGTPYKDGQNGAIVSPGERRRGFVFGQCTRARLALGVGFPDHGILPAGSKTRVETYLAVDPGYVTRSIVLFLRIGLGPLLLRHAHTIARTTRLLPRLAARRTRIAVEAQTSDRRLIAARYFDGGDQAELTAAMILIALRALPTNGWLPGKVTNIVDYLDYDTALAELHALLPAMRIKAWRYAATGARR